MPVIFLSPSTQEWNKYATEGNEELYMNLLADKMEPYLRSSGIGYVRNDPDQILFQYLRLREVIEDIIANFNDAMLRTETKEQFENVECNSAQFDFVYLNGVFDNLYKSAMHLTPSSTLKERSV